MKATEDKDKAAAGSERKRPADSAGSSFATVGADASSSVNAAMLLAVESKVRAAANEFEIIHLIANELRKLVAGRQALVLRMTEPGRFKVVCVSSVVLTDKDTPFVRWIEGMVAQILKERGDSEALEFQLPAFVDMNSPDTLAYPFPYFVWQPLSLVSGETFAGILIARDRPWSDQDKKVIAREAGVFGNAWQAVFGAKALKPKRLVAKRTWLGIAAAAIAIAVFPVPMAVLAPVEIVAREPQRVTAPIDGVIEEILVEPNQPIRMGQPILRFNDTTLRNRLQVAEQEMLLSKARYQRAEQAAFSDEKARHELAAARAEFDLKQAERNYAAELLSLSEIKAERDGVLVYSDKDRWIGRPLKTGERIMQIVDTTKVAARIELPVADAIVLEDGARVRLFLDSNPLTSIPARLKSKGYQAEPNSTQQLVYRLQATIDDDAQVLRVGSRGTAQLLGHYVPLVFYLLRRPISAIRQHIGL